MGKSAFTFGGHFGRGADIFCSVNEVYFQYGFVRDSKIDSSPDFEIAISKRDAVKLATRLLAAADE